METQKTSKTNWHCCTVGRCRKSRTYFVILITLIVLILFFQYPKIENTVQYFNQNFINHKDFLESTLLLEDAPGGVDMFYDYLEERKQDMLHMKPPSFLPQFKNPCFYQESVTKKGRIMKHLRCLPYFMVIGIEKCGTSNVFNSILTHPDVISPSQKELSYWTKCRNCETDAKVMKSRCRQCDENEKPSSWSEYLDSFEKTASQLATFDVSGTQDIPGLITGEGSPSTMYGNPWWDFFASHLEDGELPPLLNAHYIKHLLPNIKMIITLRDPAERMYSDYSRTCRHSNKEESPEKFHQIAQEEIKIFQKCRKSYTLRYCAYKHEGRYLHRGIFLVFIRDWFKVFPRNQFFISQVEYYSKNKQKVAEEIFRFLDLRDVYVEQKLEYVPKPEKEMKEKTRKLLKIFYKPFNEALASFLKDRRFAWDD